MRLEGHVAVVTGGTGGLGRAVASAFLAAGARVVATTRRSVDEETHERLVIEAVDLVDEQAMLGLANVVRERYGRCDHVVCCAGGFASGTPVAELSLAAWQRQLDLNATSAFLAARAFLPLMLAAQRGSIVFVGSRAALQPFAGGVHYSVSKAAVVALTTALAVELRDQGVTVNCVLP
ncbi:MAG: SDR family oxidoreductase, partial [Gaiellales bacterium]